jgi:hypothetical protein
MFRLGIMIFALGMAAQAADLVLTGVANQTYRNQIYGRLSLSNCSDITIQGCVFAVAAGAVVSIAANCSRVTIDSCDIDGQSAACTGVDMGGSYITIRKCRIHDIADDGIQCAKGGDHWSFSENEICHLLGCGTDGGCGPCYNGHSDGFEMGNVDSVEVKRNLVYDVRSTSAFFMDNWDNGVTIHNLLLENNIFYTPECGVVMYVFYIDGLRMYGNTFWKSNWLGLAVGPSVSRLEAYDNIAQCIDYTFMAGTYNSGDHIYDYNLVGMTNRGLPLQTHDVSSADPKFRKIPTATDNAAAHVYRDVTPANFELLAGSPAIDRGTSGGPIPTVDFYGRPRTAPYDLGAIEYRVGAINGPGRHSTQRPRAGCRSSIISRREYRADSGQDVFDLRGRSVPVIDGGCCILKLADGGIVRAVVVR